MTDYQKVPQVEVAKALRELRSESKVSAISVLDAVAPSVASFQFYNYAKKQCEFIRRHGNWEDRRNLAKLGDEIKAEGNVRWDSAVYVGRTRKLRPRFKARTDESAVTDFETFAAAHPRKPKLSISAAPTR